VGIFNRVSAIVRANLNSLVDHTEDPDKLIDHTIHEMEDGLKRARRELVAAVASVKRLEAEAAQQAEDAARWEDKAGLALRKGDEELAREGLKQKLASSKKQERLLAQAAEAKRAADGMKSSLDELEKKTGDLRARKGVLAAQVRAARESATEPGLPRGTAFDDLERLTSRVDQMEAEVEAASVLDDVKRAELEARFRELEQQSESAVVDDELAALKRKVEGG
jgi:phage shock protein A